MIQSRKQHWTLRNVRQEDVLIVSLRNYFRSSLSCLLQQAALLLRQHDFWKGKVSTFSLSSFSWVFILSLLSSVKSTGNLPVLLSKPSHFMASQLSTEYFQCRSAPSVTALWKYFFQEETTLPKCKKGDKFTGEIIAKQMCWWYLKNYWQLLLAEFKQL